ncbi:integrase, catalytic region, zinc finger, CCHC-type containing protein [Tanacetum coccineum]
MSNSNTNLQTQSSNALHNAIMEAGSKDRPPMLAPGNYVQWKSRIKRYIDTKPNRELIHYSLQNPPYIYQWAEKTVPVAEGSSETTIESAQQQPVTIPKPSYSKHSIFPPPERKQSTKTEEKAIVYSSCSPHMIQNLSTKIYKPTTTTSENHQHQCRANKINSPRTNRGTGYDNQRAINVAGARENVGTPVVQKSGIQCYNCKEYGHVSRECQKPKRIKDAAYHKEKMLLCKQEEAGVQLKCKQADWKE